jgi:hypothetical protein
MTDPERIFAPDGGMEAVLEARKAGKVGFTGHKNPTMHLKMRETAAALQFHFDAVQMPLNAMDAHYESFEKKVLPMLVKNEIGCPRASSSPVANLLPIYSKRLMSRGISTR